MSATAPVRRLAGLTWGQAARRYRRANGRFLSEAEQVRILEGEIVAAKARFRALGAQLQAGQINLPEFQLQLAEYVRRANLVGMAYARGGFAQLSRSDIGAVGARVRETLAFVRTFAQEIETGKQALDGRLLARLDQYAGEHRAAERAMRARIAKQDGHTERRRVLGVADHCRTNAKRPGCVEVAAHGWGPMDDPKIVAIGKCVCGNACRCREEFRGGRAA